jgi:lysine/arginine/ornithine transport system substrate-binding protein
VPEPHRPLVIVGSVRMKKLVSSSLTLGFVAALVLTGAARAQEKTVRIGTEAAYAPFEFKDDKGELKGYEIQLGNALCAAAKLKCEWVNADFDSLIPALNAHKIDAILSQMSITDDRKKAVDFTNQVTIAPARFVAKTGSGLTDDPATLKGKTVAVQSGTTHEKYVTEKLAGVATPKVYQTQDEAFLDVENGRADATLADATIEYDWLQKTGKAKGFDYAGKPLTDPVIFGDGTGIAVRKGDTALADSFNKALATVGSNGEFKKINDSYFPFDITGSGAAKK